MHLYDLHVHKFTKNRACWHIQLSRGVGNCTSLFVPSEPRRFNTASFANYVPLKAQPARQNMKTLGQ